MVNVLDPMAFRQQFGYPELPTEKMLLADKKARQDALIQQAMQKRLEEQQAKAQKLREAPSEGDTWVHGLASMFNRAAGQRDLDRVEGRQKVNDQRLAQATAAAQEAEVAKGQREEQRVLAASHQAYQEHLNELEQRKLDRLQNAQSTRAAAFAPKGYTTEAVPYQKTGEQGVDKPYLTVQRRVSKDTGKITFDYTDPDTGEYLTHQDKPPKGWSRNDELLKSVREVTKVETAGEQSRETELVKGAIKERLIGVKNIADLSLEDRRQLGRAALKELDGVQALDQINANNWAELEQIGAQGVVDKALLGIKEDSAWKRLEKQLGSEEARKYAELAVREKLKLAELTSLEKRATEGHRAAMDQLDVKLDSNEQIAMWDIQDRQRRLRLEIEQENKKGAADRDHDKLMLMQEQLYEVERMEYDMAHEKWIQQKKLEAEAAGADFDTRDMATHLPKYAKDMKPLEELHTAIDDVIVYLNPYAQAGKNLPGIGTGHVHEHEAMRFLFTTDLGGEGEAGIKGTVKTEVRLDDGQIVEYYVPAGAVGEYLRSQSREAQVGYALVQRLVQKLAKEQSGLEVPYSEYLRIQRGVGFGNAISDDTFVELINRLAEATNKSFERMRYSQVPQVVEAYSRGPTGLSKPLGSITWAKAGEEVPMTTPATTGRQSLPNATGAAGPPRDPDVPLDAPNNAQISAAALPGALAATGDPSYGTQPGQDPTNPRHAAASYSGSPLQRSVDFVENIIGLGKQAYNAVAGTSKKEWKENKDYQALLAAFEEESVILYDMDDALQKRHERESKNSLFQFDSTKREKLRMRWIREDAERKAEKFMEEMEQQQKEAEEEARRLEEGAEREEKVVNPFTGRTVTRGGAVLD